MPAFAAALIIAGTSATSSGRSAVSLSGAALSGWPAWPPAVSGSGAELIAARVIQGAAAPAPGAAGARHVPRHLRPGQRGKAFGIYGAMLGFTVRDRAGPRRADRREPLAGMAFGVDVNVPVAVAALIAGAATCPRPGYRTRGGRTCPAWCCWRWLVAIVYPWLEGVKSSAGPRGCGGHGGRGGPGGAGADRGPADLAFRSGCGAAAAGRAVPGPAFAAGMGIQLASRRHAGLLPGLRAVAAGRRALLAAEGRDYRRRVQRGQLHHRAGGGAAGPEGRRPPRWAARCRWWPHRRRGAGGAPRRAPNGSPWPIVPGLVVAWRGPGPADHPAGQRGAGRGPGRGGRGASGLFSTAQQLGGALGVALLGTVFFGYLNGHSFEKRCRCTAAVRDGRVRPRAILSRPRRARRCRRRR